MIDENLIRLRELGAMAVLEIEELKAKLGQLQQQNDDLVEQLAFYRRRVAA